MSDFFSPKGVFTPKHLAAMAMLLGIRTILNLPFLTIYLGPGFKLITFAYITDALCAMLFGPVAGLAFGFAGDAIGFLASSGAGGAYFPGFALSEMITCLIFALFFYRHAITAPRIICAWLINLAAVLLGLNMVWLILMYGMDAGSVFTTARFVNNLVQAPIHIVILWLLLPRLMKLAEHHRIL
jgi:ECF transporter S component (folate family)